MDAGTLSVCTEETAQAIVGLKRILSALTGAEFGSSGTNLGFSVSSRVACEWTPSPASCSATSRACDQAVDDCHPDFDRVTKSGAALRIAEDPPRLNSLPTLAAVAATLAPAGSWSHASIGSLASTPSSSIVAASGPLPLAAAAAALVPSSERFFASADREGPAEPGNPSSERRRGGAAQREGSMALSESPRLVPQTIPGDD